MHPTLSDHLHPGCASAIGALSSCHSAHPLRKFVGVCNGAKAVLDKCLADEYLVRRELNADKSRAEKERLRERLRDNGLL